MAMDHVEEYLWERAREAAERFQNAHRIQDYAPKKYENEQKRNYRYQCPECFVCNGQWSELELKDGTESEDRLKCTVCNTLFYPIVDDGELGKIA